MYLNCTNMYPLGFNGLLECRLLNIFEPGVFTTKINNVLDFLKNLCSCLVNCYVKTVLFVTRNYEEITITYFSKIPRTFKGIIIYLTSTAEMFVTNCYAFSVNMDGSSNIYKHVSRDTLFFNLNLLISSLKD